MMLAALVLAGGQLGEIDAGSASSLNSHVNRVTLTVKSQPPTSAPSAMARSARS